MTTKSNPRHESPITADQLTIAPCGDCPTWRPSDAAINALAAMLLDLAGRDLVHERRQEGGAA